MRALVPASNGWAHQQARQFLVALLVGGGSPSGSAYPSRVATSVQHSPGDTSAQEHCQGSDGAQTCDPVVLDVAEWL